MKLYQAPRQSVLRLKYGPVIYKYESGSEELLTSETFLFHHIDGMYSLCFIKGIDEPFHLHSSSEVEVVSTEWPENGPE